MFSSGLQVSAESASSSTPTPTSHHGPSRTLRTAVRVANKGVQAGQCGTENVLLKVAPFLILEDSSFGSSGDLELVCSGTRRHTRDVGTTFPSPAESRLMSSSSSSLEGRGGGGGGWGHPSKTQRRRRSKKSPSKVPPGTSGSAPGSRCWTCRCLTERFGFNLQVFPGSSQLRSWELKAGRRTSTRKRRRGGPAPPGLNRSAGSKPGENR